MRVGSLDVDASCQPARKIDGIGFVLPCGGTLTNPLQVPVAVAWSLMDESGNESGQQGKDLQPGDAITLQDPPDGQVYVVVDLTREEGGLLIFGGLGLTLVALGLGGWGLYELGKWVSKRVGFLRADEPFRD